MANIEFTPDNDPNFANEVFSKLDLKNKFHLKNNKRDSDKEEINEKVLSYLRKLAASTEKLLKDAKISQLDSYPDENVCLVQKCFETKKFLIQKNFNKKNFNTNIFNTKNFNTNIFISGKSKFHFRFSLSTKAANNGNRALIRPNSETCLQRRWY